MKIKIPRQVYRSLLVRAISLVIVLILLAGSSCQITKVPSAPRWPEDDAGPASFVRQVIPVLYGRKVKGFGELAPLIAFANQYGKEKLVYALMEQKEFIDHWSEVLVERLEVQRSGDREQSDCFGDPKRSGPDSPALAQWVANNEATDDPTASGGPLDPTMSAGPYNMSDPLRSAIELDNLYPVYRAYLFPLVNKSAAAGGSALLRRSTKGRAFTHIYLNRDMDCLDCHNSDYSTTDAGSGWNRHFPIHGSFEKALFGDSHGRNQDEFYALFRWQVLFSSSTNIEPWGVTDCGTYRDPTSSSYFIPVDGELDSTGSPLQTYFTKPLGDQATIWELEGILHEGYVGLQDGLERTRTPSDTATCNFCSSSCSGSSLDLSLIANSAVNAIDVKNLLTGGTCGSASCHVGATSGGLNIPNDADHWADHLINAPSGSSTWPYRVVPGDSGSSYLIKKLEGASGISGSPMPPGGSIGDVQFIRDWIDSMPVGNACNVCSAARCGELPKIVEGPEASAYLTAANIVDNIWDEVMGTPLTVANYFSRNWVQRNLLWNLTDQVFVPSGWSLKTLLAEHILVSPYFNRHTPDKTLRAQPYNLPNIFDPWTVIDPRKPPVTDSGYQVADHLENHFNSTGDGVHRYSPRTLVNSVHKSLGWPAPKRFPDSTEYPMKVL